MPKAYSRNERLYTCAQVLAEIRAVRDYFTRSYGGEVDNYDPMFQLFDKAIRPIVNKLSFNELYHESELKAFIAEANGNCNDAV